MKIKALVTGADGQLAKTIKELYLKNEQNIEFIFLNKNELDITLNKRVKEVFKINRFDYCINCAAYTNVEKSETSPEIAHKINAEAVKNIAESCKESNTILIHISTDYVFDGLKDEPYLESDNTNPINEYGKSKLLGETYIQEILKDYFIIRSSWLYSTYGKNFVKTIINKIKKGNKLQITTSQKGTPTSCLDLSKFINFLISSKVNKYGVYNFSALGEATWYNFAICISKHFKDYSKTNILPIESYHTSVKRPTNSVLNNSKTQVIYNFINNWEQSVNEVVVKLLKK